MKERICLGNALHGVGRPNRSEQGAQIPHARRT